MRENPALPTQANIPGNGSGAPTERIKVVPLDEERPRRSLWEWLTQPDSSIQDEEEARRVRFLSSCLLVVTPAFGLLAAVLGPSPNDGLADLLLAPTTLLIAGMVVAYGFSRTPHYRTAVAFGAVLAIAGSWFSALEQENTSQVQLSLFFGLGGVLLCAVYFPVRVAVLVGIAHMFNVVAIQSGSRSIPADQLQLSLLTQGFVTALVLWVSWISRAGLRYIHRRRYQLQASEARYSRAARGANDGLWDWDLRTGKTFFSARWNAQLGLAEEAMVTSFDHWLTRVHPQDIDRLQADIADHIAGSTSHFENMHRVVLDDGVVCWVLARGLAERDDEGKAIFVAGSLTDMNEQKQFEDQLLHDAFHDVLTGLPNRALFLNRLTHSVARRQRNKESLYAVLFLDIDRFKVVNDSLGHEVGDRLLVEVARRLESCIRPGDTVARLGGDEFTILLDEISGKEAAVKVANRIHEVLHTPFELEDQQITTSISIGIALSSTGTNRPEDLIRDADTAMYKAKQGGRARHEIFTRQMHEHAVTRLRLENDLRAAIENGQLHLFYQPIVDLRKGTIEGLEALARWQHPQRGLVSPSQFIPIAEETGLIDQLGWWVLEEATQQLSDWRRENEDLARLRINVNLSGRQFRQRDLSNGVVELLKRTGLPPSQLNLEITETVVMEVGGRSREILSRLRSEGVRVCIDDFGTGYSSLKYLHSFDIDVLKIDQSFVSSIARGHRPAIIQSILDLSKSLDMTVTAEGVETQEQLDVLRELNCESAQGYFFSRPLPVEEILVLMLSRPSW